MRRLAPSVLLALAVGCVTTAPPRPRRAEATRAHALPTPPPAADGGDAAPDDAAVAPPPPPATATVRAALDALPVIPGEESAWLPMRLLDALARATGELAATTPPTLESNDRVVWSVVMPATVHPGPALDAACTAVTRAEPRAACASDLVDLHGSQRVRFALGWRAGPGGVDRTLALPLRALARTQEGAAAQGGVCLVSAERTLRTLDLTVRADDLGALGRLMALTAAAPWLTDVILVRTEEVPGGPAGTPRLESVLSWPLEQVDREHGALGDDAWPARCDGASSVAVGVRAPVTARLVIDGARARGAVLSVAHRDYLVAPGDHVADAVVDSVAGDGVVLRRGARTQRLRLHR